MRARWTIRFLGPVVAAGVLLAVAAAPVDARRDRPPTPACDGYDAPAVAPRPGLGRSIPGLQDNCLRLNQIQVLGTHNSYRLDTTPEILSALRLLYPVLAE